MGLPPETIAYSTWNESFFADAEGPISNMRDMLSDRDIMLPTLPYKIGAGAGLKAGGALGGTKAASKLLYTADDFARWPLLKQIYEKSPKAANFLNWSSKVGGRAFGAMAGGSFAKNGFRDKMFSRWRIGEDVGRAGKIGANAFNKKGAGALSSLPIKKQNPIRRLMNWEIDQFKKSASSIKETLKGSRTVAGGVGTGKYIKDVAERKVGNIVKPKAPTPTGELDAMKKAIQEDGLPQTPKNPGVKPQTPKGATSLKEGLSNVDEVAKAGKGAGGIIGAAGDVMKPVTEAVGNAVEGASNALAGAGVKLAAKLGVEVSAKTAGRVAGAIPVIGMGVNAAFAVHDGKVAAEVLSDPDASFAKKAVAVGTAVSSALGVIPGLNLLTVAPSVAGSVALATME